MVGKFFFLQDSKCILIGEKGLNYPGAIFIYRIYIKCFFLILNSLHFRKIFTSTIFN